MNNIEQQYFDSIAEGYQTLKTELTPIRTYSESYTLLKLLNKIKNKAILQIACSDGYFSRLLKKSGAESVLGIDLSPKMIAIAKEYEVATPINIEYRVADVFELDSLGQFDIVFSSFAMSYAKDRSELLAMCRIFYSHLKPGAKLVSMNDHPELPEDCETAYGKYGKMKRITAPKEDGAKIQVTWIAPDQNGQLQQLKFDCSYFTRETFEWALSEAGFVDINFHSPEISPLGLEKHGAEYWNIFLENPLLIFIEAHKP